MQERGQARQQQPPMPAYNQNYSQAQPQATTPFTAAAAVSNAAPPLQANTARQFMVQCPPNVSPGDILKVTSPDGFDVQVSVPLGIGPGQQFAVSY